MLTESRKAYEKAHEALQNALEQLEYAFDDIDVSDRMAAATAVRRFTREANKELNTIVGGN